MAEAKTAKKPRRSRKKPEAAPRSRGIAAEALGSGTPPGAVTRLAEAIEAAERLVGGDPAVVFLTHMVHPTAPYHMGWPAWREGDRVLVQERLFVAEQLGGAFDLEHPEVHLGPRREISDEGLRISQWTVSLADVAAFVERRRGSGMPAPEGPRP